MLRNLSRLAFALALMAVWCLWLVPAMTDNPIARFALAYVAGCLATGLLQLTWEEGAC